MSLILKVFNYSNPVENYPDRQIQMLWVSLSFLKYASGWQSAGTILLINSNKTLNSAKIIVLKMLYIHPRDSCFIKSAHLNLRVNLWIRKWWMYSLSSIKGINWNALIHLLRSTAATQSGKINVSHVSSYTLKYHRAKVKWMYFFTL